jgi:CMP-N,N'-diacetyllegionaminic acid synthase
MKHHQKKDFKREILAVIPARGGSKGVYKKNIRPLAGKPLIAHTIETALKAARINRVIVSTDDEDTRDIAMACGAEVPFLRPAELARDDTPDKPVLVHVLQWLEINEGYCPEVVLWLRPTVPLRTVEIIDAALDLLEATGADSVRTVTLVEGVHHPYWMYGMDEGSRAQPFIDGIRVEDYFQRQLLPAAYRLNGLVDCIRAAVLLQHEKMYGNDMRLLLVPAKISIDIDTEDDFALCEALYHRGAE